MSRIWLLPLLLLLCVAAAPAQEPAAAGLRLRATLLGSGSADRDPAAPWPVAPAAMPASGNEAAVKDIGGGTWWRVEWLPSAVSPPEGPFVLTQSNSWRGRFTYLLPGSAGRAPQRVALDGQSPLPAWSVRRQLPLQLPSGMQAGSHFYLHIEERAGRRSVVRLQALSDYQGEALRHKVLVTVCSTALLAIALLAILFQRVRRGASYGYLAIMAVGCAAYVLSLGGELFDLPLLSALLPVAVAVQRFSSMLAIAFSHWFIQSFLELRRLRPWSARIFDALAWTQAALALVSLIDARNSALWPAIASNLLILVSMPLVLWEAWVARRGGRPAGSFVLLAWTPALLILGYWVLAQMDWLPWPTLDIGGWVAIALTMQVAVLLFGLADDTARLRRERDQAENLAGHDALTGAWNRRALAQRLPEYIEQARDRGQSLSLVFIDIDHFKHINDQHGHAAGDRCLRELVQRASSLLGPRDLLARCGGEEFVVVLPGQHAHAASAWAEQVRLLLACKPFAVSAHGIAVTEPRRQRTAPRGLPRPADAAGGPGAVRGQTHGSGSRGVVATRAGVSGAPSAGQHAVEDAGQLMGGGFDGADLEQWKCTDSGACIRCPPSSRPQENKAAQPGGFVRHTSRPLPSSGTRHLRRRPVQSQPLLGEAPAHIALKGLQAITATVRLQHLVAVQRRGHHIAAQGKLGVEQPLHQLAQPLQNRSQLLARPLVSQRILRLDIGRQHLGVLRHQAEHFQAEHLRLLAGFHHLLLLLTAQRDQAGQVGFQYRRRLLNRGQLLSRQHQTDQVLHRLHSELLDGLRADHPWPTSPCHSAQGYESAVVSHQIGN